MDIQNSTENPSDINKEPQRKKKYLVSTNVLLVLSCVILVLLIVLFFTTELGDCDPDNFLIAIAVFFIISFSLGMYKLLKTVLHSIKDHKCKAVSPL